MSHAEYDIERLNRSDEIDTGLALENFPDTQEFFDSLAEFAENCGEFLTKHSEYQVITREEVRLVFIQELKKLRDDFTALGFTDALLDLRYIEKAILSKEPDTLKQELNEFRTRMTKISGIINLARIDDEPEPSAEAEALAEPEVLAKPVKRPIILAVDDMPGLLSATAKMLKDYYTVVAVTSAAAALRAVEKQTPSLFLLDIEMPVMDGYELAKKLREMPRFSETPILFLTAKSTRDAVISAIKHGGNDYIVKPVDKELLLSKIERFL